LAGSKKLAHGGAEARGANDPPESDVKTWFVGDKEMCHSFDPWSKYIRFSRLVI